MMPAFLEDAPRRPIWLVTLADLMLLLVGFFVFLQANQTLDGRQIAQGLREGFGIAAPPAMTVDANRVTGFAAGSAVPAGVDDSVAWARDVLHDPRTMVRVTGGTDGSPQDVDAATGSGAILAADRARGVAARLAPLVGPDRIVIDTRPGAGRAVQLDIGFAGDPQ